ncbi:MAG TPA: transglutaminase family protein [Leptolyngbyaceae cyanobacterium M65_K2018_010]|nr:transglutaminase family protein [Leptolyngbyaceae cyanobacterium M65_K2018_010]
MRYRIQHHTHYHYQNPVTLQAHTLRLHPRSDATQQVQSFTLAVDPRPIQQAPIIDTDGNHLWRLWFDPIPTESLVITTTTEVATLRTHPFDYLAEPWAVTLPIDYPASVAALLQPYLHPPLAPVISPQAIALAEEINHQVDGNVGFFLTTLTQRIYETCEYTTRSTGHPWPPGMTWSQKLGSCRDFTVLFMDVCRAAGLAARFVSGYEEGDSTVLHRDLHAWAEVYVPGGGWRGFDPTHGLAVADRHIALVASPFPQQTVPVTGTTLEGGRVSSRLDTEVRVALLGD